MAFGETAECDRFADNWEMQVIALEHDEIGEGYFDFDWLPVQ